MKKLRSTLLLIVCSVAGLILLLNWRDVWGRIDQDALDIEIASAEEIDRLSQGKEEHAIEPEILLNGSAIAYDVSQNMLLIPQDPSKSYFDGKLSVPEGQLFFLEDEEGFSDKAASMAENRVFRLYWVRETDVWMYNVYFTSMPVMCLMQTSVDDVDENGGQPRGMESYGSMIRIVRMPSSSRAPAITTSAATPPEDIPNPAIS